MYIHVYTYLRLTASFVRHIYSNCDYLTLIPMLRKILSTCLGIKRRESVLIVTDENKLDVASEIESSARELSGEVLLLKMRSRKRHAEEPPRAVAEAMKRSDVVMAPTTFSLTHTEARKKACEAGARIATMPGITLEMLREGAMLADYTEVKKKSEKLARLISAAKEIKIETALGCDFRASLKGRNGRADTGIFRKRGSWGNLPAGEAFVAPLEGTASGTLVFDGSFSSLGVLAAPLKVSIARGKVASCEGEKAEKLNEILGRYKNARNTAEIGFGTNERARIIGNVLEDEKVLGTVHVAIGDNHTFGGRTRAEVHLDGIITRPSVWLDEKLVMREGELIL